MLIQPWPNKYKLLKKWRASFDFRAFKSFDIKKLQNSIKIQKFCWTYKTELNRLTEREFDPSQFITKICNFDKVKMICISTYTTIEWLRINLFMTDTYEKSEFINPIEKGCECVPALRPNGLIDLMLFVDTFVPTQLFKPYRMFMFMFLSNLHCRNLV